jgi:hypothetical protein
MRLLGLRADPMHRSKYFCVPALLLASCNAGGISDIAGDKQGSAPEVPPLIAVAAPPVADQPVANAASPTLLPVDVTAFIEKRDTCDHFRGEDSYDADREKFLKARLHEFCDGTDKALKSLRFKYTDNPEVISALAPYDDKIE